MAIALGAIQFDENDALRHLRRDLSDDWFPDPRRFEDLLKDDFLAKTLEVNFRDNHGQFQAGKRHLLNIPKSNFTLRYALETSLSDRAVYNGLAAYLLPFFDSLIPWQVFSHRASPVDQIDRVLFRRPIQAWQNFLGVVRTELKSRSVLLSTDLANYYENIDLNILRSTMSALIPELDALPEQKANIRAHLELLFSCLREWCYLPNIGLPQNRDASSFLANIYMLPVGGAMLSRG